jgi:hypothetical protein
MGAGKVCCASACAGDCEANTCDSQGKCQPQPARTPCGTITGSRSDLGNDITKICDGGGNCNGPVVDCTGVGPCKLTSGFCCRRLVNDVTTLGCSSAPCGTDADLGLGQYGENCKGTADCPLGQSCCVKFIYGFEWLECNASPCQFQACQFQSDCVTGTCNFNQGFSFSTCEP